MLNKTMSPPQLSERPPRIIGRPKLYFGYLNFTKQIITYRLISSSIKCSTTNLSLNLTPSLTTFNEPIFVITHMKTIEFFGRVIKYLDVFGAFAGHFDSADSFDFSNLYTTLSHNKLLQFVYLFSATKM